jgi:SAM-dependent methyltransferase
MVYQILFTVFLGVVSLTLFVWTVSNIVSVLFGAPAISSPSSMGWKKFANKDKTFLDLGCGGGMVLLRAAPYFGHVYGIEASPAYYLLSKWRTRKLTNVTVIFGNFFMGSWPKVDYIYCYLLERPMRQLRSRLIAANTVTMSLSFPIPEWEADEMIRDMHRNLYVYYPPLEGRQK